MTHLRLALLSIAWLAASGSAAAQESSGALVDANTRFAFKFFQQSVVRKQGKNVLIAPTALSLDFALLQNGASPAAKADILDAFNLRSLSPERPGYLELPRLKFDYRGDIRGVLGQMGLGSFTAFSSFSPAVSNPEGARLTCVLQEIWLNVDEKGTEVVSVGVMGGVPGDIHVGQKPEEPFRMIVNRPFFFAILDKETNAILYMGAVVEP